jgi:outer membrane protein TolC
MRPRSLLRWLPGSIVAVALGAACQLTPPPIEPLAPPSAAVLERFQFSDPDPSPPLAPIHVLGQSSQADSEGVDAPLATIEVEDVLRSVELHFPLILAALEEVSMAEGRLLQARGGFDTRLGASASSDLEGYYESDRLDFSLEQPLEFGGLNLTSGYRLGRGDFAVYDGKAQTDDEGEWRVGLMAPLLQGRTIDPRRLELWRARLAREQAEPVVVEKRLDATRKAADAYWKWVAWGRRREIAVRLLALAEDRMAQIELAVNEGLIAAINLTENQRLIVDRRANLVRAERGLQQSAIALSLFWRDERGQPAVPADDALPYEFPTPRDVAQVIQPDDAELALARRPELRAIELELSRLQLEEQLASNDMLPRLDLGVVGSRDLGDASSAADDKGPFELTAQLRFQLPLQRRAPRGKVRETQAKISKLTREAQFLGETVRAQVQDIASALTQSWLRIGQARENVRLANQLAEAERLQLQVGESDLLRVNLREQQAALAAASLVDVLEEHFRSLTDYRAALGLAYDEVVAGGSLGGRRPEQLAPGRQP